VYENRQGVRPRPGRERREPSLGDHITATSHLLERLVRTELVGTMREHGIGYVTKIVAVCLCIWEPGGGRRLEVYGASPQVVVDGGVSAQPSTIVAAVSNQLGLDVAFVRVSGAREVELECIDAEAVSLPGASWRAHAMSPTADARVPWQRLGWLAEATAAVDNVLQRIGRRRIGAPVQQRHSSVTGLVRYPTTCGQVWLKAVPRIFSHEATVVARVHSFAEDTVPRVLADTGDWWLSEGFVPTGGPPRGDFLTAHAALQLASVPFVADLRGAGCPERSLGALHRGVTALARRGDLLAERERQALRDVARRLRESLLHFDDVVPTALIHGDLSVANVGWGARGWTFFDWTDACVGHPFVDLALSLCMDPPAMRRARSQQYASVWADVIGTAAAEAALAGWPLLGAAHHALTYETICDEIDGSGGDHSNMDDMLAWFGYWVRALIAAASQMDTSLSSARGKQMATRLKHA
jgi:hypothetical protein